MNDKPFRHTCRFGTEFFAEHCDFREGVVVRHPARLSIGQRMSDLAEMVGWHALNIHPQLVGGFQGYDCIAWHEGMRLEYDE